MLAPADRLLRQRLWAEWKRLEPACLQLLAPSGAAGRGAAFADFVWAYSIFWCNMLPICAFT